MKAKSQGQELAREDLSFLDHVIKCIKKKNATARDTENVDPHVTYASHFSAVRNYISGKCNRTPRVK